MKHSTLFLDESGKSSLAEKQNEPFVLTGVILEKKFHQNLAKEEIQSITQKYIKNILQKKQILDSLRD